VSGGDDNEVKETEAERTQSKLAIERWNDYQERFAPLENRLMAEVRTTPGEMEQAQGYANAASEQQFSGARMGLRDNLFSAGFNPASGGFASRMAGLATDEALATGMNEADIGQAMSDQEVYGLQGVTQLGQGNSATAFEQYGRAAGSAQDQAINDARTALNERLAMQQSVGQVAGAATAYGTGGVGLNKPSAGTTSSGLQSGNYGYGVSSNNQYTA